MCRVGGVWETKIDTLLLGSNCRLVSQGVWLFGVKSHVLGSLASRPRTCLAPRLRLGDSDFPMGRYHDLLDEMQLDLGILRDPDVMS